MFKAMIFGFLVGVISSQQVKDWASNGLSRANIELRAIMHIEAFDKIAATLS
jgi:hypothetical protein